MRTETLSKSLKLVGSVRHNFHIVILKVANDLNFAGKCRGRGAAHQDVNPVCASVFTLHEIL